MPEKFEDILKSIKNQLKGKINPRTKNEYTDNELYAMAVTAYKKKYGKNPNESIKKWKVLEWTTPIILEEYENESEKKDFIIEGTAINETVTRNSIRYSGKELKKSYKTLRDKPILKDHGNVIDSIVGRTTENIIYDSKNKCIRFKGKIMDEKCKEMISDGRIKHVSIGAKVDDLVEVEENGQVFMDAIGLEFLELSLTPVPGDANASLQIALEEAYNLKVAENFDREDIESHSFDKIKGEGVENMPEEENKKEDIPQDKREEPSEEVPKENEEKSDKEEKTEDSKKSDEDVKSEENTEDKKSEEKIQKQSFSFEFKGLEEAKESVKENIRLAKENNELKEKLTKLSELEKEISKMKEAKEKVSEGKMKTKGIVQNKKVKENFNFENYCIENKNSKYSMFIMPDSNGNLIIDRGE